MDICFTFTTLLLVNLVAVVDSGDSCECKQDGEKKEDIEENMSFRLEFTSDIISDIMNKKQHYFCNIINADLEWSVWTECAMSNGKGVRYKCRYVKSAPGKTKCCFDPSISLVDIKECQIPTGNPSRWSSWSQCKASEEGNQHRSLKCHSNQSECLISSNGSSFEIRTCIPDSSTTEKDNGKKAEKRYTLTEIIVVALCCLLMGVLLTTLVFVLYMKRALGGCFSKHTKDVQGDSKQQSGLNMQFLTESGVVKKYCPNNPKSADSKNDNKADETMYKSLSSNQVGNDQQTYDQINVNESGSDRQGHQPSSSRLDGHNYFVLERQNVSQESRARNLGRSEPHAKMDDEVKDSKLGTEEKQSDAAHQYFLLEHIENGHNQD